MSLWIGRLTDSRERFEIGVTSSKRVLICGKTGYGKSYTLGVFLEELNLNETAVCIVVWLCVASAHRAVSGNRVGPEPQPVADGLPPQ